VLIIDNYSTYYTTSVRELCERKGVILLYLPPYSPDFNLIKEFLEYTVRVYSSSKYAKAYFKYIGVSIDDDKSIFTEYK